jgi:hypothetical protein
MHTKAAILLSATLVAIVVFAGVRPRPSHPVSHKQPVLVELFTSEGCSSCPPADALLKKLSEEQPFDDIEIIALEEHVDYWNHQGWSDPFSSSDFSNRQNDYAAVIPQSSAYTPQMIVDGHVQFIGSREQEAEDQIRAAAARPKARLLLSAVTSSKPRTRSFELRVDPDSAPLGDSSLDFYVAVTEKGLGAKPNAGENSGASLVHSAVVRSLKKLHSVHPPLATPVSFTVDVRDNWAPENLTVVAFLVQPRSRQVQAVGMSAGSR